MKKIWESLKRGVALVVISQMMMAFIPMVALAATVTDTKSPSEHSDVSGSDHDFDDGGDAFSNNNESAKAEHNNSRELYYNYGFSIPSGSTINEVNVSTRAKRSSDMSGAKLYVSVSWDGGTNWSSEDDCGSLTANYSLTLCNDGLWGRIWTSTELSNSNFKVKVKASYSGGWDNKKISLDWIPVTVEYTLPDTAGPSKPILLTPANGSYLRTADLTLMDWQNSTDDSTPIKYMYQSAYDSSFTSIAYTSDWLSDSQTPATGTPQGTYYWRVKAKDNVGNESAWSDTWVVHVDNTQPTADIVFDGTGPTYTGFKVVFSEDVKEIEAENPANYFLNNWPGFGGNGDLTGDASIIYDSSTKTATVSFTQPGWYISPEQLWGVQNIHDLAGNLQIVNPYTEYSTPMVPPVTVITLDGTMGLAGSYVSDVSVTLAATDPPVGSGVKATYYMVDGVGFSPGMTVLLTEDGTHVIKFYSVDYAGNEELVHEESFSIDQTAPVITILPPTPDDGSITNNNTPEVRVGTDDEASSCTLLLDDDRLIQMIYDEGTNEHYVVLPELNDGQHNYSVTCTDPNGNSSSVERSVIIDTTPPIITLLGLNPTTVIQGASFTDMGATAFDNEDGDITDKIVVTGSVDPNTLGTYVLKYDVTDSAGNDAEQVIRTVNVTTALFTGGVSALTPSRFAAITTVVPPAVLGATTPTQPTSQEVKGTDNTDSAVKGSSDTVCPWWWIIALALIVVLAFVGGVVGAAQENSILKKYYYVWPVALGAVAWVAHYFLHNDFKATWFCNNYWLVVLLLAVIAEFVYRSMVKKSEK